MPADIDNDSDGMQMEQTLLAVLAILIPPGPDGRMPGAAETGFAAHISGKSEYPAIQEGLARLMQDARDNHGQEFSALGPADQARLLDRTKVKNFRFFSMLANELINYYYRNRDVVAALGLEPRPPFPLGHHVEDGDLSLLEAVYERGRKYRE